MIRLEKREGRKVRGRKRRGEDEGKRRGENSEREVVGGRLYPWSRGGLCGGIRIR